MDVPNTEKMFGVFLCVGNLGKDTNTRHFGVKAMRMFT